MIEFIQVLILLYFFILNGIYFALLIAACIAIYRSFQESKAEDLEAIIRSDSLPKITFIVPAFNEEKTIEQTVKTLLHLTYRYKQIIVVNDGSKDLTLDVLKHSFGLVKIPPFYLSDIKTAPIISYYKRYGDDDLLVIDKQNGGSKADAVNAGINACMSPLFVNIDGDTLIDDVGLSRLVRPFLTDSAAVVAGGTIRILNGCKVKGNRIVEYGFPLHFLTGMQCLEYLRAFYLGRMGWNFGHGNLIVSGAFGLFYTDVVREIGGFDHKSSAEDMEIIVRIHKHFQEAKKDYRVITIADPVAWTEAPEYWKSLESQRERWHRGLIQVVKKHINIFFNPRYGFEGLITFPYFVLGEMIAPLIEALGYVILVISYFMGWINYNFFWMFLLLAWGFTLVLSIGCILIEELSFRKFQGFFNTFKMLIFALVESFGYRQMTVFWRLMAFINVSKNKKWDSIRRREKV